MNDKVAELFEMAAEGELPDGFSDWSLCDESSGWTIAHEAAAYGKLPAGFNQWGLATKDGWTVAHEAAFQGHLPADFDKWELRDSVGWTVAHVAATRRDSISRINKLWHLRANSGWTVAHEAAIWETLPPDFDQWGLTDNFGRTVAQVAQNARGWLLRR